MAGQADEPERAAARALPPLDPRLALAVVIGGALGTLLRTELATHWAHDPAAWPWATFVVNLAGAAVLGWVVVRTAGRPHRHGLLGTGLCGGLTTFSTFQLEVLQMLDAGHSALAFGYVVASVGAGLLLARWAGRLAAGAGR
ncbi:MAG: fluoride efflux transporter CrcB [Solirubrobacteraceae bacterium]|nr:fluoride efflux transporter CrcB [Solirubrobacteraceae bacterium]